MGSLCTNPEITCEMFEEPYVKENSLEKNIVNVNPEELSDDRAHGEMIPHEVTGSLAEIKCDFPFIRLKSEPARQ
ncbi:hypothetical protein GRJ2_000848100 [Grus japonensis]|uniref:Uncharacterized protein n=1 Tax=Grus japonensis TaxID=30415 RepID=A0ABC9WEA4_GRUJA